MGFKNLHDKHAQKSGPSEGDHYIGLADLALSREHAETHAAEHGLRARNFVKSREGTEVNLVGSRDKLAEYAKRAGLKSRPLPYDAAKHKKLFGTD